MTRKKNIAIVINALAMGGAEKQCVLLAKALNPHHNVTLIILSSKRVHQPLLNTVREANISYKFLSNSVIKNLFRLTNLFKELEVEFIFSYLATDTVLSGICGNLAKVPFIFGGIRNSFIPKWKFTILRTIHNRLLNYTIANNYAGYNMAIDFGYKPKVFVIPNGIEVRKFDKNDATNSSLRIISLGRLVIQKRYDIAIRAIARLKEISEVKGTLIYSIVGKGPEFDEVNSLIHKYGVNDIVEIITNATNVYGLLDKADIYLCSSSSEGISNSLLEAMNCALPIVATDVGDNSRLVLHNQNGVLCEEGDFAALANGLKELVENPKKRTQMGYKSHKHLVETFSFETFQKKYLRLIANAGKITIREGEYIIKE